MGIKDCTHSYMCLHVGQKQTPSINNSETEGQLRMRKLDSASHAKEGRKKLVSVLKSGQTLTGKGNFFCRCFNIIQSRISSLITQMILYHG